MSCRAVMAFSFCQALLKFLMIILLVRWVYNDWFDLYLMLNITEPAGMRSTKTVMDVKVYTFCHIATTNSSFTGCFWGFMWEANTWLWIIEKCALNDKWFSFFNKL
ncbi:hypothetical protein ILYODFUR_020578 [Ilyodon furcidens]|uniref:Uncharacterized protein n=1 Tax=Ilyodon furcidens TaxID=33524 RepID=A0ABV0TC43_9TELE